MLKRLFSLAVLACTGLFALAADLLATPAAAVASLRAVAGRLVRSIFAGPPAFAHAEAARLAPSRPLVAAKTFERTLEQRQRPRLTQNWRLCAST
jgi:hypothetical protein